MQEIDEIKRYILYLRNRCGLSVSLHTAEKETLIASGELIHFNTHENSYCICVKSGINGQKRCVEQQKKVRKKCKEGAFFGVCHCGVAEYVFPIRNSNETVGFVSVSGYKSENGEKLLETVAKTYDLPYDRLERSYGGLKEEIPTFEEVSTLIMPLCRMLELAYQKQPKTEDRRSTVELAVGYVKQNLDQSITLTQVCRHLGCSESCLSHLFKKTTGQSFRAYLTDLRLEKAKLMLKNTSLNVTEIAFAVGFSDSNYFSNVFKNRTGLSPVAYRRKQNVDK